MRNTIVVVFGRKGSGKSNLTRRLLLAKHRVLTIDPAGEYEGVQINDPDSLAEYLNARGEGPFRVAYRDKGLDGRDMGDKFRMIQDLRRAWVCFEEAGMWVGPTTGEPAAKWFVNYGRHNELSTVWVARRPTEVARDVTANADVVVSFQQHEPRDLEYLTALGGAEAAERIAALGPHEWDYVIAEHAETVALLDGFSTEGPPTGSGLKETPGLAPETPDPIPETPPTPETPETAAIEAAPVADAGSRDAPRRKPGRPARKST